MGSISIWHWIIVLAVVLLVFGTKRLRNAGSDLGEAVKGFKKGMSDPDEPPARIADERAAVPGATDGSPATEARSAEARAAELRTAELRAAELRAAELRVEELRREQERHDRERG